MQRSPRGALRLSEILLLLLTQPPRSLESCSFPEEVPNTVLKDEFKDLNSFPAGIVLEYTCSPESEQIPGIGNKITCGTDFKWSELKPFCKEKYCKHLGSLTNGKYSENEKHRIGSTVNFFCLNGFILIGSRVSTCESHGIYAKWNNPLPSCKEILCQGPPAIHNGFHNGSKAPYPYGTVIKYSCKDTFLLAGKSYISCGATANGMPLWKGNVPKCQGQCKEPLVENGIKLSGVEHSYTYGKKITFQCKHGYFMVGSYSLRCGDDSTWVPGIPSCKKISPKLCGAPIIPGGRVDPLKSQYEIESVIIVNCNLNYAFLDETIVMTTRCQGYNLWNPPVQPCFSRTSPDTCELSINNGRITGGKKNYYKPGDRIIIKCNAGFVLKGAPVIQYIGGKKWLPNIPHCSLSIFLKLVLAALLIPILLLGIKIVHQKFWLERSDHPDTSSRL